jgi:hypothetical protein
MSPQCPSRQTVAIGTTASRRRSAACCERYVWTTFSTTLRSTIRAMMTALVTSWRMPETTLARRRITTSGLVANASICRIP